MFGKVFGGITHAVSHTASQLRTQVLAPQFNATVDPLAGLSEVERAHILAVQRRAADEDSKLSQQPMVLPRSTASTVDATASLPPPSLAPSTLPSRPSSASSTETEGADDTSDDDDDDSGPIPDLDQIGLSEVTPADMRLDGLAEIGQERLLTSQESIEEQPTIVVHSPSTNSNGAVDESDANELEREEAEDERQQQHADEEHEEDSLDELEHYSSPESDTQDVVEPVVQIPGDQEDLQLAATGGGDESPSSSGDEWNCEYAGESFTAPIRKSIEVDEPTTTPSITLTAVEGEHEEEEEEEEDDDDNDQATVVSFSQSNERPIYQTEPAASSPPPAADTTASSLFNYDQTDPTEWTNVEPLLQTQEIELSSNETDQSVMNKASGVEMDEEASSQTFYGDESSNPFLDGASFADDQAISELVPVEEPDEEVDEEKFNNDNERQLAIDASVDEQLSTALAEPIPSSDDDTFGVDEKIISQAEKTFATVADHADSFGISNIAVAASSAVIERQTRRSLTETTSRSVKQPFSMPAASQAKLQSANKIASATLDGFGGKSLKNFGGLFSRPKVDFSSFATSVKKSTEAALKKATDSVASSFSSSSVVSMSQDSFNSNNQPCTVPPKSPSSSAINADNALANSNKSSDQWSALEVDKADNNNNSSAMMKSTAATVVGKKGIQPSPVVSNTFRVSCNSDSTEDTGYSSRCSPEDEFYRVGSDGAQFLITYDSSRKLGVDTVKAPLSPRRRINPFIEDGIFSQRLITSVIVEQADDQLTKSFHVSGQKRQLDIVEKVEPGEQEKFHLIAEQSFWSSEPLQSQQLFGEIDGPQEISQAGKDSTPKIEEVETLPLPSESTPLKYPPQQSIATSGADEIAKLFTVEDSAPDSSACTQMYDSSEVSSEQFDEDAQKRITEIESEFLLQNNQSADSVEDWQMCPLCQMAEVHVRPDGVSINGQPCGNCGLTVCSKCGHVVEQNGRKVWLCGICDSNIAETNGRWYCDATKSKAISEDDNSKLTFEKSQEVDSDISDQASDSSDSYPDVVIEVPSSPVKQLDFDQEFSTSNSKQCYKVFRDIEKHFMNNFDQCDDTKHEGKVDHHDQHTGHFDKGNFETDPFKTVPISVGQSPTFEKLTEQASPSDVQLSIGEEIFGKIVPPEQSCQSTNSNNAQEDSIDYAQAMRYYNTQPFYIHRPGPVYTILEDDEEVMELNQDGKNKTAYMAAISASRSSTLSSSSSKSQLTSFSSPLPNSYVGLDRPAQQMQTSGNASTEQLTSTVSSDVLVQHFFATSTTSTTTTSITASKSHTLTAVQQSNSTFTPKPVRIAPPPPPPSQYSISRDAKIEKSIHQETSNKPTGGRRHSADVPLSTDVNDSMVSGSLNGTAFKPVHSSSSSSTWTILAGQKKSDTPSSSTVAVSFALPVVRTVDMDVSDPSSRLPLYSAATTLCTTATTAPATTLITTNEADDDEAVVECSGTGPFVSRLKRSPAMLLNCIKNETDLRAGSLQTALQSTPTSALTACSSTSYPSSRLIDSAIPTPTKVVSSTSCGDTLQSGKTFLNERLFFAQSSPGEMGRRKLPNIPKIASNRHQQDVDEQLCNIIWSAGPVCSSTTTANGSGITGITGGSSYNNVISMPSSWKNIGQTLRPQHSTPLATNCRRLLPPTLARVLLKQELREALTKRLDKLEAAEIEANQREFVVGRYMATGVYPQSAGVDSAPSVVRCGLSPEMVRGCVVHFDRSRYLSSIRQRESSKAEFSNSYGQSSRYGSYGGEEQWNNSRLVRKKESFVKKDDSVQTKRNDFTVQTSDVLEKYKDASTQTVQQSSETTNSGNFVRFKPKDDLLLSKHKNVGVSTSDGPTCRTISTSTDEIDEDRLMARRRSEGNKKWRNLNSKSFTYFSADDDFASRESRRSKIRREIARRREKFSSYEDLFNLPPHRADSTYRYMDDGMELNNYITPSLYSSNRFSGHYGSLPRIDRLYDYSPMSRNALYDNEPSSFSASYPLRPYQKYDRLYRSDTASFADGQDSAFHRANYDTLTWRDQKPWFIDGQRSLSSSLPYLNNLYESLDSQPECSFRGYSRGRRFGEAGTEQVNTPRSSSMLSHYANYLHNDFLRRSSALDDGYGKLCEDRSTAKCMPYADSSTEFNCRPSSVMEPIASRLPYDKYDEPLNDCLSLHGCRTDAPMETYPSTRDYCSMTAQQPAFNSRRRRSRRQQDQEPLYSGVKSAQYDADLKTQSYNPYLIDSSLQNASVENHHRQRASSQILLEEGKSIFRQASSPLSANIKRLLLVRDVRDRSGHGIGMRVIGGKILPGSDGELVAYVAAVYKGGLVDLMEEVKEGDQILEWNGIKLTGKTYEEVQSIIDNTEGEFEIVLRSDANLNQVYRLEEGPSSSLDKGYESDCCLSNLAHPRLAKLALQRKTGLDQTNDRHCQGLDFGKASPCFSTTPRSRSPFTANQQQNSLLAQDLANGGLLKLRVCFDHTSDTLFVTVLCAARLPNVDAKKRRPPNPFVKIYILPERIVQNKRRTKFIARSNNPVWNQTVVYKDLNLEQALGKMLEFTVWSYDRFKQNTFLGKVIINLSDALHTLPASQWHPLQQFL